MKIEKRNVIQAFIALFVMYAINATEALVIGAESGNTLLDFVSKLANSVSTVNIVDVATWLGVYALISYAFKDREFKLDKSGAVVAIILSYLYMSCFSYKMTQDTSGLFGNSYQVFLTIIRFTGLVILFYVGYAIINDFIEKAQTRQNEKDIKVFIISAALVFAGWLFWIVMAYPGTVSNDGVTQIGKYYFKTVTAHHPPFSSWIMGTLFDIGNMITNDGRFGIFLYLLFQAICGALIIGYSISTMYYFGISKILCYASAVFFAVTPIFGMFSQWYEKDLLYSLFTLLFLTTLVKLCLDSEKITIKDCIVLTLEGLLCVFLRNNGIYAVIPAMIALVFLAGEKFIRITIAGCTAAIVIISAVVNGPVFDSLGIEPTNIREALSVPMQQSARYIIEHGDEVTEEEVEVLQNFFNDYGNIPNIYDPFCSDSVKNTVFVEKGGLPEYFATWFKMGLKHPQSYIDAFMCLNYGYLAPTEQNAEANGDMPNQENEVIMSQLSDIGVDGTQNYDNIQILKNLIFMDLVFPILRYLSMPGIYTWFMIVITAIFLKKKNKKGLVILIPNIINILVCLASPLCNGMRYELPVVLSVPLLLAVCAKTSRQKI